MIEVEVRIFLCRHLFPELRDGSATRTPLKGLCLVVRLIIVIDQQGGRNAMEEGGVALREQ